MRELRANPLLESVMLFSRKREIGLLLLVFILLGLAYFVVWQSYCSSRIRPDIASDQLPLAESRALKIIYIYFTPTGNSSAARYSVDGNDYILHHFLTDQALTWKPNIQLSEMERQRILTQYHHESDLPIWYKLFHDNPWPFFFPLFIIMAAWLILSLTLLWRHCRETLLLPVVALLTGIGLVFLLRLAAGADVQYLHDPSHHSLSHIFYKMYQKQLVSFGIGWTLLMGIVIFWKDFRSLARYKYLVAAAAVFLLMVTTIFGHSVGGQQLSLHLGSFQFQPHDPVKLLLVIFMAAFLAEKEELVQFAARRSGFLTALDFRYMGPLVGLWLMIMAIVLIHKDLGAEFLLFGIFLGILYIGTGRMNYLAIGLALMVFGGLLAYRFFPRVQTRVAIWINPWKEADGNGYQICQSLMALGSGRVVGAGLGGGYPENIPAIETDMIYSAISENLGLLGAVALIGLFLVFIERTISIALREKDRFGKLLAAGLGIALALQTFVILGGVTKLMPLTGVTLPFISFGGSSLVVNMILLGIVLKIAEEKR